jgi:Fur family ferric uptake transcriptional regulator
MPHRKENILQQGEQQLRSYLTEHGMKHTPERYSIMATACRLQHFTIDELRASLTELSISRATIYNTLSLLEDARLVQKLDKEFGVRTAQYEWVQDSESTVQIVCTKCGRISPVKDSTISRMLADKRWSNFVPHHFSLYMFGQCKVCRRKVKG